MHHYVCHYMVYRYLPQVTVMIPLCIGGFFVPKRHIDVGPLQSLAAAGGESGSLSHEGQLLGSAHRLSSSILYDHATRPDAQGRSCGVRVVDALTEVRNNLLTPLNNILTHRGCFDRGEEGEEGLIVC